MRPLVIFYSLLALIYSETTEFPDSSTVPEDSSAFDFFSNSTDFDNSTALDNSTIIEGSGVVSLEGSGEIVEEYRFVLPIRKKREATRQPRSKRHAPSSSEELSSSQSPVVDTVESGKIIADGSGDILYESAGFSQIQKRRKRDSNSAPKSKSSSENISIDNGTPSRRKREADENLKKVSPGMATVDQLSRPSPSSATASAVKTTTSPLSSVSYGSTTAGCVAEASCFNDDDCQGGYCRGNFLGTCNCNACLNYWQCYSDDDCGGFHNACNMTTNLCNCFKAFQKNGYSDTLEALARLCNVKQCRNETAAQDCYGLPCNTGRCYCK